MKPIIYYGIHGEGQGHISRAIFLLPKLREAGYEVKVFGTVKAYQRIRESIGEYPFETIPYLHFAYDNNTVSRWATFKQYFSAFFPMMMRSFALSREMKRECVLAAISDCEPVVAHAAVRTRIPLIALDHQQIFEVGKVERSPCSWWVFNDLKVCIAMIYLWPSLRLISSFFSVPCRNRWGPWRSQCEIVGPLIREGVLSLSPKKGEHGLVYQTSSSFSGLPEVLKQLPGIKYVYGTNLSEQEGMIQKPFDEEQFLKDLESCSYVVMNGGYSLICEALYLKKPILCLPVTNQPEQEINAAYVERMGFGQSYFSSSLHPPDVKSFVSNLEVFRANIQSSLFSIGNENCLNSLLSFLLDLVSGCKHKPNKR